MHRISSVIVVVALVGACDKDEAPAKAGGGEVKAAAVAPADKAGATAAKKEPAADTPAKADDGQAAAQPASDGEFGVAACDDYVAKVEACTTFDRSSKAYTMLTEAWKKGIADGKGDAVAEKCAKAAELFKCPAK